MDPYTQENRSFDTDLLILRSLFALNPDTQLPISTGYILTTDGVGGLDWIDPIIFGGISLGNLTSTVTGLGSANYVSTSFMNATVTSTTQGLGTLSYVSSAGLNAALISTTKGLGTLSYVSSSGLAAALVSTTNGLGTLSYVSTAGLNTALASTTANIFNPIRYISVGNLLSTTDGILNNPTFYASHVEVQSTAIGLGTLGYVSASTLRVSLVSTVVGLGNSGYVSSTGLNTILTSTTLGLGTLGYVSAGTFTNALNSTVQGLGTTNYVSTSYLVKYVTDALANSGTTNNFVSAATLNAAFVSTNQGLGTFGYVSSATLGSALASTNDWFLDATRYISAGNLLSTTAGVLAAQTSAVNNAALVSTVTGLGNAGYVSTSRLAATLVSTVAGLGTASYVSSLSLQSTTAKLLEIANASTFITIDRAGNVITQGGQITINNVAGSIIYLSTFLMSSVTYRGTNGTIAGVVMPNATSGVDMIFSTAILPFDAMSSFINVNSRIYVDLFPTFAFNELNTMATKSLIRPISTFIAYGSSNLSPQNTSFLVANSKTTGFSNYFQQQIRLQIPGNIIANNYTSNYIVYHYLPSTLTINFDPGLKGSSITVNYGSTNSVFLTVQNLP